MRLIDYAFKYSGKLKINGLAVKILHNQLLHCVTECHSSFKPVDSSRK